MKRTLIVLIVGVILGAGATPAAQRFRHFYTPAELMKDGDFYEAFRMGYASGVVDTLSFVVQFGEQSSESYEADYKKMQTVDICLRFRATTVGTLTSYATDIWREAGAENESAAALLAASCYVK